MATPGRTETVSVTTRECEAHRYHSPLPAYLELHHVVPRDWQAAWRPSSAPTGGWVWLPILVALCRTGHGNVHMVLERIMRSWAAVHDLDVAERVAVEGLRSEGIPVGRTERAIARRGCDLWVQHGGDLQLLVDGGHFGAI
jgi:hypothetical protein